MATIALDHSIARPRIAPRRQTQRRLFVAALVLSDALALTAAFAIAYFIRFQSNIPFFEDVQPSMEAQAWLAAALLPTWLLVFAGFQLYNIHFLLGGTQEYSRVFNASAVALSLVILVTFFAPFIRVSRGWVVVAWVAAFLLISTCRFILRRAAYFLRRRGWLTARTLIVGTDEEAFAISHQLTNTPTAGAEIVGYVANHAPVNPKFAGEARIVGSIESLPDLVDSLGIEELIISTAGLPRADLLAVFETFANSDQVELRFSSGLYELFTSGVRVKEIGNVPLMSMNKVRLDGIETAIKTIIDRTAALLGLVILLPMFAILAALIKLDSPGPVFHRRRVLGGGMREFDAFKFRTMFVNGDEILARHPELIQELWENGKLKQDPRITRAGKWLRRISFDELPQLVNVLAGQMSLVGPRMITPEEGDKYGRLKMNLLTVKPGLTGLWQVRGRSDVTYEERVRLDMHYIRNYTVWLDLQILLQTIPVVVRGRGAY